MKKKLIAAIVIITFLVIAVFVALNINEQIKKDKKQEQNPEAVEKVISLPKLKVYTEGEQIGVLDGYTMDMDTSMLRNALAVATAAERTVEVSLETQGETVLEAKYELRTVDGERLIDSGEIAEFVENKGRSAKIPISSILENNKEYLLTIILGTKKLENIKYYTRVMVVEEAFVKPQLDFAKDFSNSTFDDQSASKLVNYLEPDASLPNNNLGTVTLSSNYAQLTWGKLTPEKITDVEVQLKEVYVKETGISATYRMTYQIQAEGNNEIVENYDVIETITVWTFDSKQYVLAYEREMKQIWEVNQNTVRSSFLDLGIQKETVAEYEQSDNGEYISFVVNGQLWLVNVEKKEFTNIYTINDAVKDKAEIMISHMDNEGNVNFIIYGYSAESEHMGKNGISFCKYKVKDNQIREMVFIPYDKPLDILKENMEKMSYVNDEVLYLMVEKTLYYVNFATKETGKIVENLEEGDYAVNSEKNVVAYNTSGSPYENNSITVVNLSDNSRKEINAGTGYKIKVCGYSGENLIYGIAPEKQIDAEKNKFYMSSVTILDNQLQEVISYSKDKIFISDIEISDSIIHLKRVQKGEAIEDDQLIDNTVKEESIVSSSYYEDTKKNRELALSLKVTLNSSIEAVITKTPKMLFDTVSVDMLSDVQTGGRYCVYALGNLRGIYENRQEAEQMAKESDGLVIDGMGEKIWTFEENYGE